MNKKYNICKVIDTLENYQGIAINNRHNIIVIMDYRVQDKSTVEKSLFKLLLNSNKDIVAI